MISDQRFAYSRCRDCGLRFESERPPEAEISRFYPETYYDPRPRVQHQRTARGRVARRLEGWNERARKRLPDPLPARLAATYEPRGACVLLDYGCGSDVFLNRAREAGWSTIGADVSERVLAEIRASGHRAVAASSEGLAELEVGSVTVVRMNQVIEHLYRPGEVLAAVRRTLEPGGTLHASTPNPRSVGSAIMRSRWLGLDCPRHVVLYPPDVLARLLREVGFRRVEVVHEVLTKDLARSLGHLLHDLGCLSHAEILGMAERPALADVLDVPARLAARAGLSDRFHCFSEA